MTQRKRIHFLTDFEEVDDGYLCQRCELVVEDEDEAYDHRKGVLTDCLLRRVRQLPA